jgi:hypothetical protein
MDFNVDPSTVMGEVVCVLFWMAGILSNMARQMKKQNLTFKQYWTVDGFYSFAALFVSIALIILFYINKENSVFAYFSVGYIVDSFINKAEAQAETAGQ